MIKERIDLADGECSAMQINLHVKRYQVASLFCQVGAPILDIACGTGYGTQILKRGYPESMVIGADNSADAIEAALARFGGDHRFYLIPDAHTVDLGCKFGTVVCLETIEHLADPDAFCLNLRTKCLAYHGTVIMSAPVAELLGANPYHLHYFTPVSFREFYSRHFRIKHEFLQEGGYLTLIGVCE